MQLIAESSNFITIGGLPLHPLVVHVVVVFLPVSVLGLMAIILVPKWRAHYGWLTMGGLVIGMMATVLAAQAGEQLAAVTGVPSAHSFYGQGLALGSVLLTGTAIVWFIVQRDNRSRRRWGSGLEWLLSVASFSGGIVALVLVTMVGHSGATAVWQAKMAQAQASQSASAASTQG